AIFPRELGHDVQQRVVIQWAGVVVFEQLFVLRVFQAQKSIEVGTDQVETVEFSGLEGEGVNLVMAFLANAVQWIGAGQLSLSDLLGRKLHAFLDLLQFALEGSQPPGLLNQAAQRDHGMLQTKLLAAKQGLEGFPEFSLEAEGAAEICVG